MIAPGQELPLRVTTHACANGETVELRLMAGAHQIGPSRFVNGQHTDLNDAVPAMLARAAILLARGDDPA
jgi:hypothetical protein